MFFSPKVILIRFTCKRKVRSILANYSMFSIGQSVKKYDIKYITTEIHISEETHRDLLKFQVFMLTGLNYELGLKSSTWPPVAKTKHSLNALFDITAIIFKSLLHYGYNTVALYTGHNFDTYKSAQHFAPSVSVTLERVQIHSSKVPKKNYSIKVKYVINTNTPKRQSASGSSLTI